MALVEAKNPAERKKMIVAIVLGSIAIISLAYMLFGSSSSSNKNINGNKNSNTSSVRPSPTPPNNIPKPGDPPDNSEMLTQVVWPGAPPAAPEAGRNIFAYYVPPTPTPPPPPTPIPTPPPPQPNVILSSISPVNVYAHTGDFNLDVTGDKFTPDTRIFIGGAELQTRFVSPQQLSAKVPAQIISFEGARAIKIQSRDGKLFSNTATLNVMPAPVPNYTFIGVQIRKGANDQAILKEKNGNELLTVQRGGLVGDRFRVTSISPREVVLTDTSLKIKHTLQFAGGGNTNPIIPGQPRYTPPTTEDNEP
ncbi:MAG: hypothetical protein DMF68_02855 [Acidobacteria bacterium]|nr:MAG: hypothetical protein DMF68_02855 [Acidobacteriota bacterium]